MKKREVTDNIERYKNYLPIFEEVKNKLAEKLSYNVVWEEAMGWFIIPKPGERISWAIYDYPQKTRSEKVDLAVVGKATVHGIDGVEIVAVENNP